MFSDSVAESRDPPETCWSRRVGTDTLSLRRKKPAVVGGGYAGIWSRTDRREAKADEWESRREKVLCLPQCQEAISQTAFCEPQRTAGEQGAR